MDSIQFQKTRTTSNGGRPTILQQNWPIVSSFVKNVSMTSCDYFYPEILQPVPSPQVGQYAEHNLTLQLPTRTEEVPLRTVSRGSTSNDCSEPCPCVLCPTASPLSLEIYPSASRFSNTSVYINAVASTSCSYQSQPLLEVDFGCCRSQKDCCRLQSPRRAASTSIIVTTG